MLGLRSPLGVTVEKGLESLRRWHVKVHVQACLGLEDGLEGVGFGGS